MKFQEGPLFGALFVGAGIGYLLYQKTGNARLAVLTGLGITVAGYAAEVWLKSLIGKKK